MTTYPIHPGDRLQRRIVATLSGELSALTEFEGVTFTDDRIATEIALPVVAVHITETENTPPASHVWHVGVTVRLMEDRPEATLTITGDTRPRHELRAENLSALLFGKWDGETLADKVNAISNGQGCYVLKTYGQNVQAQNEQDTIATEYSFTCITVSTEQ
jgi:hypothetical protein